MVGNFKAFTEEIEPDSHDDIIIINYSGPQKPDNKLRYSLS